MRVLVTGYAGFIGSNLTRMLFERMPLGTEILGIDAYTYAARPDWVLKHADVENEMRFRALKLDLRDAHAVRSVLNAWMPDQVYHLAAESHVCRSIDGPRAFAETNFMGTFNLIDALRGYGFKGRMVHVSTDEAFGELERGDAPFSESTPIAPRSPYAASKAASDLMVKAFAETYGLDFVTTRCTNNYGPNQHEEKLIPRTIERLLKGEAMTVHGAGDHVRDWIWVDDHCRALLTVMEAGRRGELYCVGGGVELSNLEVIDAVARAMREELDWSGDVNLKYTNDRPTDDKRYAVTTDKLQTLGWCAPPTYDYLLSRLRQTVRWYSFKERGL